MYVSFLEFLLYLLDPLILYIEGLFFAENLLIKFNPYNVPYCNCMVILNSEFALQVHSSFPTWGF